MKYKSINELDAFSFHDAEINEATLSETEMIWSVSDINATTKNTQNDNSKDMRIENAVMKFENVSIKSLVFSASKTYGPDKKLIKSVEAMPAEPEKYAEILSKTGFIFGVDEYRQKPDNTYSVRFNIDGTEIYNLTFSFSKSIIEWDEFSGEAWYEHPRFKKT